MLNIVIEIPVKGKFCNKLFLIYIYIYIYI